MTNPYDCERRNSGMDPDPLVYPDECPCCLAPCVKNVAGTSSGEYMCEDPDWACQRIKQLQDAILDVAQQIREGA